MIEKALEIAIRAHNGQFDKGNKPYIFHPITVALKMKDDKSKIVALLHDVIEDSDITIEDLKQEGFSECIIKAVEILTKNKNENYQDYLSRIKKNKIAKQVKIEDIRHNIDLTRIPNPSENDYKRIKKYQKALEYFKEEDYNMELGNMIFGNSRGKYSVDRSWQKMFCNALEKMGFDNYGNVNNNNSLLYKIEKSIKSKCGETYYKYENDVFIIMPYYWGEDEDICKLPNFVYKPTGFEMSWYKYPLRDSYMNQSITQEQMKNILINCKKSLGI